MSEQQWANHRLDYRNPSNAADAGFSEPLAPRLCVTLQYVP